MISVNNISYKGTIINVCVGDEYIFVVRIGTIELMDYNADQVIESAKKVIDDLEKIELDETYALNFMLHLNNNGIDSIGGDAELNKDTFLLALKCYLYNSGLVEV